MSRAKILIVEDEGIEALDLQYRLISLGYTAPDIASTGEEAVAKAEEACPDLILMDIMLDGEIDGVMTAERIQARFDVPIVYLTAYADEATLQRAKITEPYGYIVKPFKERELHIAIDMALYKHKMERKLKESEKWLATTLRSIGDAVIATDKSGLITFMNPVAEGLTGWKLEEILNIKLTEVFNIINRNSRKPVENPVTKVINEGFTVGMANHTILIARDGTEIPIDDSAAPIKDDNGNIVGVILVFRDITEREKAEEELRRAYDELEGRVRERTRALSCANEELKAYAARLELLNQELREFAFVAAHDLQEPLRKIMTFGDRLKTRYESSIGAQGRDYLERMVHSAERMRSLLGALLNYSRISTKAKPFEPAALVEVARDAISDMEVVIERAGGKVEIGELAVAKVDSNLMRQLFQNLISNAMKYCRKCEKPVVRICGHMGDGVYRISVEDNGIGFDEQHLDRIFRPFQRLHGRGEYEGIGMGLAICRKIAERHGGMITAKSTPGEGSTFMITLPLRQTGADAHEAPHWRDERSG